MLREATGLATEALITTSGLCTGVSREQEEGKGGRERGERERGQGAYNRREGGKEKED